MFQTWIIDESGKGGGGDVQRAIDRRAAWLQPSHPWSAQRASPRVSVAHVHTLPSAIPQGAVSRGDAAILIARDAAIAAELSDSRTWQQFHTVIPVIDAPAQAQNIPPCLQHLNALVQGPHGASWPEVLADDVFARAVLPRPTRSVFVSYRRAESLGVARQLAEELAADGFDVFLDERSIARGADFAREITYRLSDVDMLVVLATIGLDKSRWVRREIALATLSSIGVLAVDWSKATAASALLSTLMPDQICPATLHAGKDVLTDTSLRDVVSRIYEIRVASIARRVDDLLPLAAQGLAGRQPGARLEAGERLGEIVARDPADGRRLEVVTALPCRPTPVVVWGARSAARSGTMVRCVYQEAIPRDERVRSLAWALRPHRPSVEIEHV